MKKLLQFVIVCTLLLCSKSAWATHIYGGELLYTHVSGNNYTITLTLYGDCSASNSNYLAGASPHIMIYRNTNFVERLKLTEDQSMRKEVSPVCPEDEGKTSCKSPTGTLPGAMRYVYSRTITLLPSADWRIVFAGTIDDVLGPQGQGTLAGRSGNITNISNAGEQLMFLEAILNNSTGPNSSPQYSSVPTPFFCINRQQQYNQGAIDKDNDSLSFSLVPALINSTQATGYVAPYSGAMPLAAAAGSFSFNQTSGQLRFEPNVLQKSLVVNKVEEYKNGVLVGSSMREMTFIVLDNCSNTPPKGNIENNSITGGAVKENTINVCANTPNLHFIIQAADADNDSVTIVLNNVPQGANATINTNAAQPYIDFSWNTENVATGTYNFFVTYTDNACPLFSSQTIAYTINVVAPISISHEVLQPTNCIFRQKIAVYIKDGVLPRKITIKNSNDIVLGEYLDSTGVITDSFKVGTYTVFAEAEALQCRSQYSFTVEHSGTYPLPPAIEDIHLCPGDAPITISAKTAHGATIQWHELNGQRMQAAPMYTTTNAGTYQWLVNQRVELCESVKDTLTVTVHDYPEIEILNTPERVCAGDGMYLLATGGVKYEWQPEDKIVHFNDSPYTFVRQPTTYVVTGYSEYGCANTDTITYSDIEQCCTFSYPDAFTPNSDGINDGWRPVTYGNVDFYLLSVYNRWGQRVYISSDPRQRWDGSYKGKVCEMDTYYYYLKAKCVTGHEEVTKGSFILLR